MNALPALAAALLGCALLGACTDDAPQRRTGATGTPAPLASSSPPDTTTGSPSPSPAATTAPPGSAAPASVPPFPADTAVDTQEPTGGPLTVVAVRAGRHPGFDRVVFELRGQEEGEPGWRVEYVDRPSQQGSGDEVEVAGEAVLEVLVSGVAYPVDTGQEEATADLEPDDTALVREVDLQATFEGQFQAFVGVEREAPFRVYRLADPARVVLEVRHS